MPDIVKTIDIRISGEEAEEIVKKHVEELMKDRGYELRKVENQDGPWPDTFWNGESYPPESDS